MTARVITVANRKGGVGKTTTVVNVAAELGGRGRRVLVVDLDTQAHTSLGLGVPSIVATSTSTGYSATPHATLPLRYGRARSQASTYCRRRATSMSTIRSTIHCACSVR